MTYRKVLTRFACLFIVENTSSNDMIGIKHAFSKLVLCFYFFISFFSVYVLCCINSNHNNNNLNKLTTIIIIIIIQ